MRAPRLIAPLLAGLLATGLGSCAGPGPLPRPVVDVSLTASHTTFVLGGPRLPAGVPVTVTLFTPTGTRTVTARTARAGLELRVPYARAGLTPYRIQVGPHVLSGALTRRPGPSVTPLILKIGARAVRVSAPRPPALVLHPLDAQGNVADQPVLVRSARPDGRLWQVTRPVSHLYAWTFLPTGSRPGRMHVVATSGSAAGEVGDVDVLPGPPAAARWTAPTRVDSLRDALGNRLGDGESLSVQATVGGWNLQVPLTPVNGRAALPLPAPQGRVSAEGWSQGREPGL